MDCVADRIIKYVKSCESAPTAVEVANACECDVSTVYAVRNRCTLFLKRRSTFSKWSPDKKMALVESYEKGLSVEELSKVLGVTEASVRSMASKLGLSRANRASLRKRRSWSDEEGTVLRAEYARGAQIRYIASSLGRTNASVSSRIYYLGLSRERASVV